MGTESGREGKRWSYPWSHYVGKCEGPDPKEWWRTLWRRPLRTNKDGFSFTGRMHLHSLEAKASEPGLMKRNPSNWLDFNANERERETERVRGRKKKKSSRNFFFSSSSAALHKTRSGTSAHPMEVVAQWLWCKENILKAVHLQTK